MLVLKKEIKCENGAFLYPKDPFFALSCKNIKMAVQSHFIH